MEERFKIRVYMRLPARKRQHVDVLLFHLDEWNCLSELATMFEALEPVYITVTVMEIGFHELAQWRYESPEEKGW